MDTTEAEQILNKLANDYQIKILSKISNYRDFNKGDHRYYGKVDNQFNSMVIKNDSTNLVLLERDTYVLDFVADAFNSFKAHVNETTFKAGHRLPKVYQVSGREKSSFLYDLLPRAGGFLEPRDLYYRYLDDIYGFFTTEYLSFNEQHKRIKNHKDFIKAFINYSLSNLFPPALAFTMTGFMRKKIVPIEASGLVIPLQNDRELNVFDIINKYGNDPTLAFYSNAARKYGFMLKKNHPGTMVADLKHPMMRAFMKKRGSFLVDFKNKKGHTAASGLGHVHEYMIDANGNGRTISTSVGANHIHQIINFEVKHALKKETGNFHNHETMGEKHIFVKYYDRTCHNDISLIKKEIFNMYNTFVNAYPFNNTYKINRENELVNTGKYRKKVTEAEFNNTYPDVFWLRYYLDLRINEEQVVISKRDYQRVIKSIANVHTATRDIMTVTRFIDDQVLKRVHFMASGPNLSQDKKQIEGNSMLKKMAQYI